jgi:ElaB/YqjD/DUF883 family membrane-anchored ribosome-binding protein
MNMNTTTKEKLATDFKALIDDIDELLKTTTGQTGDNVAALRQRLEKKLEAGKTTLDAYKTALSEKTAQATETTENYVRENPWTTLGIAAGVGLLFGWFMRRD